VVPKSVTKLSGAFSKLSIREKQIALAIINEKKVIEIAYELALKSNTISTFKKNIFDKLGVTSDIGLFKLAVKEGIIKI
jgi:DNA-binding NarL/FixJ family response regulator